MIGQSLGEYRAEVSPLLRQLTVQQLLDPLVKGQSVLTGEGRKHRQFIHSVTIVADRKRVDEGQDRCGLE